MLKTRIVLALETSTSACSVALKVDEAIDQLYEEGNNLHSKRLLEMVDQLLQKHGVSLEQVELIASGVGPGAFTGLRIGVGVAQGLAYSHSIPVAGVSSLQALARSVGDDIACNGYVVCGLDARMSEIYWTAFSMNPKGTLVEYFELHQLGTPKDIKFLDDFIQPSCTLVGNAWPIYFEEFSGETRSLIRDSRVIDVLPQARYLIEYALDNKVAQLQNGFDLSPLYIRDNVAKKATTNPLLK